MDFCMSPLHDFLESAHPDLRAAQKLAYEPSGIPCKLIEVEPESKEYGACHLEINNRKVRFRVSKITPTKIGQFVTLWKRIGKGPIQPYDVTDPIDLFVVSARKDNHFGQFVFPKTVLLEKGILSKNGLGGKRALRIYPPWDKPDNQQAKKSQSWQLEYFFDINAQGTQRNHIQQLFSAHNHEQTELQL